jgi:hypothetical protein
MAKQFATIQFNFQLEDKVKTLKQTPKTLEIVSPVTNQSFKEERTERTQKMKLERKNRK